MSTETSTPPQTRPAPGTREEVAHVADQILATEPILTDQEMGHYARALIGARYRMAAFVTGSVIAAVILALLLPKQYTAKVMLLPTDDGEQGFPSQLSGIASSFGLQFPFGSVSQSDLYPTILASDRLLGDLIDESFAPAPGETPVKLVDLLVERKNLSEHEHRMRALTDLRENVIRAHKDTETGVVSLQVTTHGAELSADVANRLTSRLEKYLIDTRQVEGSRNRAFLSERLDLVSGDLKSAEENLKQFREKNRRVNDSPELLLQVDRLRREVLVQEQIFLELQRQTEVAKIEEVKNTPVLRILDDAHAPIRPSHPKKVIVVVMGFVLSLFAVIGFVLLRSAVQLSPNLTSALQPFAQDVAKLRALLGRKSSATGA
ncbi:MAG: hypothetical protein DHS20C21_13970 [Gemmatimonadota bacterium]|nr:MAG: hypothetical protein DHS20C21_13970 [Gemmatimonadota bacterium]